MLLKLIGSVMLIAASFSAGYCMSKSLYRRRDFLKAFIVFLGRLATCIRYSSDNIFTLVNSCADSAELSCFRPETVVISQPFENIWNKCVLTIPKGYALKKADIDLLLEFGSQLGKTDVEGQLKHIELYRQLFEKQLEAAEDAIAKKSKLYKTMGLFVGTAAALMMM